MYNLNEVLIRKVDFMRLTCLKMFYKQKGTGQECNYETSILNPIRELKHRGLFFETEENRYQFQFVFRAHCKRFNSKASNAKISAFQVIGGN